jgi:hypothetical protein
LNTLNSINFVPQSSGSIGYTVGSGQTILKTTNGGSQWDSISTGFLIWVPYSVFFTSANAGYIAHGMTDICGAVLKTTNGGTAWSTTTVSNDPLFYIYFTDVSTGFGVGGDFENGGLIVKTTNAGINWNVSYISSLFTILKSISFPPQNPAIGFTSGMFGTILKTTNNGSSWNVLNIGLDSISFFSIYSTSADTIYTAGSYGTILKTINSGTNWQSQTSGTNKEITCLCFINSNTGYAVGANGLILKTTTGGIIGIKTISGSIPSEYYLYQNYPNPFNPTTMIKFEIPNSRLRRGYGGQAKFLKAGETNPKTEIRIYDVLGKEVVTLVNSELQPGTYEVDWDASNYPSGVYYYRLFTENYSETKKMILVK